MRKNPYDILNVSPLATDDEVKEAYRILARKYHPDNFAADDAMAELAAEKMKEINEAYDDILRARSGKVYGDESNASLDSIRTMISKNKFAEAENALDRVENGHRGAEWHFLKSICLDRRGMTSDAMNELNIACQMDPKNEEYARSRNIYYQRAGQYGNAYRTQNGNSNANANANSACNCCANLLVADCCCEMMGGDLCRCI